MGDLKTESTSYPTSKDTATAVANTTDEIVASHINGPTGAIVAIENELGTGLRGVLADLATRLNINMNSAGGLLYGASFPVSPANTPHLFWRTDLTKLYVYNTSLASYDEFATSASLADYVSKTIGATISAVHQFNPTVAGAPFTLGANATGQKVIGLNADTVDSKNPGSASGIATLDANTRLVEPANTVYDGTGNRSASPTSAANAVPVANASGKLVAGWGGSASTIATLDANTRLVEPANTVYDGAGNRSASATAGANKIPVAGAGSTLDLGWIPAALTGKTATTAVNLSMHGEGSATTATATNDVDFGTVTAGDRILVVCNAYLNFSSGTAAYISSGLFKWSGTATIDIGNLGTDVQSFGMSLYTASVYAGGGTAIIRVTGTGTLVMRHSISQSGLVIASQANDVYYFFLKKA